MEVEGYFASHSIVSNVDFIDNETNYEDDNFDPMEGPHRVKNYWAVILGLLCVVVVIGNVLVIISVATEKVLQNITNYFIVSLAVADLLVAGCVMPFSVYVLVRSDKHLKTFCLNFLRS